jgi:hypothetical protein
MNGHDKITMAMDATNTSLSTMEFKEDNVLSVWMAGVTDEFPTANDVFTEKDFLKLLKYLRAKHGKVDMWMKIDMTKRNGFIA